MATNATKPIASNRRARFDYAILDTVEAGIVLQGSEVKSLRLGQVRLADAYARVLDGAIWLDGVHIPPYQFAHGIGAHDPDRSRKLLLHTKEIERIGSEVARERLSMIPLSLYFKDKRDALAERDSKREIERALGRQAKGRG
jgi:SsrA-binding protein